MPFPLIPVLGAAVSIFDSIYNTNSQSNTNQASMDFQRSMYNQQRSDAIADRDYANRYNSPGESMARLKAAGLNPNLIYGQAAGSNISAPVRSASAEKPNIQAPQINSQGVINALMAFYDVQNTQAKTDNLRAQIEAMKTRMSLDNANIPLVNARTNQITQQTKFAAELQDGNLEALQTANRLRTKQAYESDSRRAKLDADTAYTLHQDTRSALKLNSDLKTAVIQRLHTLKEIEKTSAGILLINQEIRNLRTARIGMTWDNTLKELEAQWNGLRNNKYHPDEYDRAQIEAGSKILQAATIGVLSRK